MTLSGKRSALVLAATVIVLSALVLLTMIHGNVFAAIYPHGSPVHLFAAFYPHSKPVHLFAAFYPHGNPIPVAVYPHG